MRSVIATLAAVVVLIVLAGTAFIYSGAYYVGADRPHWPVTSWLLDQARIRSIRAHAAGIAVPAELDDQAKILAGLTHFADHCVACHGAPGVPQTDLAEGLYPRPPNLADAARFYTPGELFWIILHGIKLSGMPAWGEHSEDELWATVAFLEKLPGMTEQDYANLVAASQAQGGHHHDSPAEQPPPGKPSGARDHGHPLGQPH